MVEAWLPANIEPQPFNSSSKKHLSEPTQTAYKRESLLFHRQEIKEISIWS